MNEVIGAMGNGGAVRWGQSNNLLCTPLYPHLPVLLVGEVEDGVIGRAIGVITHPAPQVPPTPFTAPALSFKVKHIARSGVPLCIWLQ